MNRSTESPMEFEWQNGHGQLDAKSPFSHAAMKRTYTTFDSPQKLDAPALREPKSQPFLFSQPPTSPFNPALSPFRGASFQTPRKSSYEVDMSSGPENISSPEQADNEDTPEAPKATLDFVDKDRKPRKQRESLFDLSGYFAPTPGSTRPKYSNAIAKRILKKRRRAQKFEKQLALARRPSNETSEEDVSRPTTAQEAQAPAIGRMASLFAFIEQYPNAPALISKYLQTFFTAAILTGGFYVIYSVWSTIRADVDRASEDSAAEILAEMAACAKSFVDNRCGGDSRLPALEAVCNNWELCMNRDPNSIRRAQVSAHTFATIINSFVEPISMKTMLLFGCTIVLSLVVTNTTLGFLRRSQDVQYHPMPSHPSASYMHTPAQPSHLTHYPGMGYGQDNYPPQLGWSSGNMWNGQSSIDYQPELKRHKSRSRSPAKRLALQ